MPSSGGEHLCQIDQHPRRRPPDIAPLVRQHKEDPGASLELTRHAQMVARVDDKGEGHLERFRYLERIDRERERHPDYADYRRYLEPGSRDIGVEPADHLHVIAREPDFLLGLAKRRVDRVRIALFDPPSGKGDLPGM